MGLVVSFLNPKIFRQAMSFLISVSTTTFVLSSYDLTLGILSVGTNSTASEPHWLQRIMSPSIISSADLNSLLVQV